MHRLLRAGVAACLLMVVPISTASAAAGGPTNVYIADASFTFVARGLEWSGSIHVVDDRLNGVVGESVSFQRQGAERVCYAGTPDEFLSNDSFEFFGQQFRGDATVRDDLSSARAQFTASGQKVTVDGCTGEIISSKAERHAFDAKLTGTGEITVETSETVIELPDGTFVPATSTTSSRSADGKVEVDKIDALVTDASLFHGVTLPN
jgi:hypothetical protein